MIKTYQITYWSFVSLWQGNVTGEDALNGLAQLKVEGDHADAVKPAWESVPR